MGHIEKKSAKVVSSFALDRVRAGKTRRDHRSGAWARRLANQDARGEWSRNGGAFPTHTLNGHRYYRGGSNTRGIDRE